MKGGRGLWPFKSPENHFNLGRRGRGACNQGWECAGTMATASLSASVCLEAVSSDWSTDPWHLEDGVLFAYCGFCKLCARYFRNTCSAACLGLRCWGCLAATVLRAEKDWNSPQFTIQLSSGNCEPSVAPEFQDHIRVCQYSCCLGGETDFWCFLLCHHSRILSLNFFF